MLKCCLTEHLFCDSCGIGIGPKHLEALPFPVNEFNLCSWCFLRLNKYHRIELQRSSCGWNYLKIIYLLPDGRLVESKFKNELAISFSEYKKI